MRCGSREPVYLVVSQHLYDPTGVVSEETPATTGVFVDVPRRRITRTLFGSFITNGAPLQTRLIYRIARRIACAGLLGSTTTFRFSKRSSVSVYSGATLTLCPAVDRPGRHNISTRISFPGEIDRRT